MRDFENNPADIKVAERYCKRLSRIELIQAAKNPLKFSKMDGWNNSMLKTKTESILCSLAEDVLNRRNQSSAITGGLAGALITFFLNKGK